MATIKIQVKLGTYEFSAEGDEVSVRQQYAAFMEFVNSQQSTSTGSVEANDQTADLGSRLSPGID